MLVKFFPVSQDGPVARRRRAWIAVTARGKQPNAEVSVANSGTNGAPAYRPATNWPRLGHNRGGGEVGLRRLGAALAGLAPGTGLTSTTCSTLADTRALQARGDMDKNGSGDDKKGRSLTIPPTRLTRQEIAEGIALAEDMDYRRPQTRAECAKGVRPCPYVSCKHHLYLDVNPLTGSIKINFPDVQVWEMQETCALDVAERGGQTLEEVGVIMNLTRERIRQVECSGLEKLQAQDFALDLEDVFTS